MKCIFQIMSAKDGTRCPPFVLTREDCAKVLSESCDDTMMDDHLVIVLMHEENKDMQFSNAPVMTVRNFIAYFGVSANG